MNFRRQFLKQAGASALAAPFLSRCRSAAAMDATDAVPQRLIIVFSPNGTVPDQFWPETAGEQFELKRILQPLEPFRDRLLTLQGVSNGIRGDGDSHMRGMSCLLTGIELFPGNIQGGSHTPAGWAKGISIDQEIRNRLQADPTTETRFGSLEFGVAVPNRADPWTRMVYAGPNQPVAPVSSPYQMFDRLYGQVRDRDALTSVLDEVQGELKRVSERISAEDRQLMQEHEQLVREMEKDLDDASRHQADVEPVDIEQGIREKDDNIPKLSKMQVDMLVHAMQTDMTRVATLQYSRSVGNARMSWLGVEEGHHQLSHDPDRNEESQEKLIKINTWYSEQVLYLAQRLDSIPERNGNGSMLDHTLIVWTNELGKGNSHTLDNIPWLVLGGGPGFKTGRALQFEREPHNRLLMALANAMGHPLETFGNPRMCEDGMLTGLDG